MARLRLGPETSEQFQNQDVRIDVIPSNHRMRFMPKRRFSGFTLVEIMIVVAVIGVLAALSLPSFQRARMQSQNSKFINDLRVIESALQTYAADNNSYPADEPPKIMPPELVTYLPSTMNWSNPTPIGGYWDYAGNIWGIKCGIGVQAPSRTADEMTDIDTKIDDGNLDTGNFRYTNAEYIEIVEWK